MTHRPLYRNRSRFPWFKIILFILLIGGTYWFYTNMVLFQPQKLVENSVLTSKNFATKVVEVTSPKKIKAYLFEEKTNPIISINFLFKDAGIATNNKQEKGISNVVAALLTEGAGDMNALAFKEELESRAIGISFDADMDDFKGSLVTIKDNEDKAYELLRLALSTPLLEANDMERVKAQNLEALKRQQEQPSSLLSRGFAEFLYGNHPYSRNPLGESKDVAGLNRVQLQDFIKNNLTRKNLVVGIAGDISQAEAAEMLDKVFGGLPENGSINFVRPADVVFDARVKNIEKKSEQNLGVVAAPGVSRNNPDFYPLYIANYVLGGAGLSSRLSQAIREKEGLTYSIYSYLFPDAKSPLLKAGFSSTPDNFPRVVQMLDDEWLKFGENGITQKELDVAKNYLIASYNLRFAGTADIAEMLAYMQKENLGLDFLQKRNDYVKNVKLEDVNKVAKKFFTKNKVAANIGNL